MKNTSITEAARLDKSKAEAQIAALPEVISLRVAPNSYFSALFLTTFLSAFLIYLESDLAAALLFAASWTTLPLLAWFDRIIFDGKRLKRTGILPRFWAFVNGQRYRLKISDIEQVETRSLRALKRGGNIFYRYRTEVQGKNLSFVFTSGGEDFRRIIHALLPKVSENALDQRSAELRDYLREPKETLMKAEFAKIPSAEVLENSINEFQNPAKAARAKHLQDAPNSEDSEKAEYLRILGNELRVCGYLLQALETFRRALFLNPKSAHLLFDFARCLHSFAGSERNERIERKAFAALRLAEKRAAGDAEILTRLGESYFQYGKWERARKVFQTIEETTGANFRSLCGLAEVALREGKIAHVIHHFSNAERLAETSALRRRTRAESEYFARLNADEDYMEMEISRMNLLENLESAKKTCLKIAFLGFPTIVFGLMLDELITNIGWAISCVSLLFWVGLLLGQNLLSSRVPLDFDDEE